MNEKQKNEEMMKLSSDYGFKTNLHQRPSDVIIRHPIIEIFDKKNSTTARRLIYFATLFVIYVVFLLFLLSEDTTRKLTYLWKPICVLTVGFLLMSTQFVFMDVTLGSLIKSSFKLIVFTRNRMLVKQGKRTKSRDFTIYKVKKDGTICFIDGFIGKMFLLDGVTSPTAFPSEIYAQEQLAKEYQNGRQRTQIEIIVTSSQRQNPDEQLKNLDRQIFNNKQNKGISDIAIQQKYFVENFVKGVKSTVVQYLIIKNNSERGLEEHKERLDSFVSRGLYYSVTNLSKKECDKVLKDIAFLK